eukprot:CAMPEP_0178716200 /NCGR_PEP_ID=MMETSP0699-20121125/21134_1 /TAXON_ID=265572 /ORGANISM="Extubocellulus spinifer, Strain CCMP396" /LENGTH=52 /DNA_ID=CAMNT_0020365693 /DNA_START=92 /DNA_END=247 /DNA_ORIENTATION=-
MVAISFPFSAWPAAVLKIFALPTYSPKKGRTAFLYAVLFTCPLPITSPVLIF